MWFIILAYIILFVGDFHTQVIATEHGKEQVLQVLNAAWIDHRDHPQ